jgi:PIN domain nuclease of toxin-antitoxin system
MRLLLDTNVLIWALSDPKRLGRRVQSALTEPQNEKWLSPVTPFEIAIKVSAGKLDILSGFSSLDAMMTEAQDIIRYQLLPITLAHASVLSELPLHHRDPFDRLMIAQAIHEDLTILSSDRAFAAYDGLKLIKV